MSLLSELFSIIAPEASLKEKIKAEKIKMILKAIGKHFIVYDLGNGRLVMAI